MVEAPVVLWSFPAAWGMPSASPFCTKVETWLRMTGLPHEVRMLQGLPRSGSGKLPYIELPDGSVLSDSQAIIERLTTERGVLLDAHLVGVGRATALMVRRLLEEHLYWQVLYERWADERFWPQTRAAYFAHLPAAVRWAVPSFARRSALANAAGHGISKYSAEARQRMLEDDVAALAAVLGDDDWFVSRPSHVDAVAFGVIGGALSVPFEAPSKLAVLAHPKLVAHAERVRARWWPELAAFPRA